MFVVRNLKMETFLWKDPVISIPPMTIDATPQHVVRLTDQRNESAIASTDEAEDPHTPASAGIPQDTEPLAGFPPPGDLNTLSTRVRKALAPYLVNFISISATLRFPPPYPI